MNSPPKSSDDSRQCDRLEGMDDLSSRWKNFSLADPTALSQNHNPSDPTFPSTSSTTLALRSRASSAPISVHTSNAQCTLYCLECALSSVIAAASALSLNSNSTNPRRRGIATSSSSRGGLLSRPNSPVHHHWTLKSSDMCSRGSSHARIMKPRCAAHRPHQRTTIDSTVLRPLVPHGAAHRIQLMQTRRALLTSGSSYDQEGLTTPEKLYIASFSAGKDIATLLIVAPPPSLHDLNFDNANNGLDPGDELGRTNTDDINGATGNDDMTLVSEFTHLTLDTTSSSSSSMTTNTNTPFSSKDISNRLAHLGIDQTTPLPPISFAMYNAAVIDHDDEVAPSTTGGQSFMPYIT
ncbi:hypothetical protein BJ742DRAFT_791635 [Cladochytrium replicatum]|nr:hypothetical protein BJ742DRAFT_791635 [Cladochytrium replicatum]